MTSLHVASRIWGAAFIDVTAAALLIAAAPTPPAILLRKFRRLSLFMDLVLMLSLLCRLSLLGRELLIVAFRSAKVASTHATFAEQKATIS
jgi:hypothetical protein